MTSASPKKIVADQIKPEDHLRSVGDAEDSTTTPIPNRETDLPTSFVILYATTVDDLERTRIAVENRIRSFEQSNIKVPDELAGLFSALQHLEKDAIKALEKSVKKHPLGPWAKATIGIGNKQLGRLLNAIGNPGERSNVAKLWAYCGMSVVDGHAPKMTKGVRANWNVNARMRIRLISESCIKQMHSPYRAVYDDARAKYVDYEISDLHKHNRALRIVSKTILKDLWVESKRIQSESS